jgi:hypothetical protein
MIRYETASRPAPAQAPSRDDGMVNGTLKPPRVSQNAQKVFTKADIDRLINQ